MNVIEFPVPDGCESIPLETTTTVQRFEGITFKIIDCDGECIYLESSDGKHYAIESTWGEPLELWKLADNSEE